MAQGKPSRAGEKRQHCDADKRGGGKCGRTAGWGTDHKGIGYCKHHGGSTPAHQAAAIPAMAAAFAHRVDVPDMGPRDTLLWMIKETTDEVAYYGLMIKALNDGEIWGYQEAFVDRPRKLEGGAEAMTDRAQETRTSEPRSHIWIQLRGQAFDRLARYIKMAEDIGIAEREIQLAERMGGQIADMIGWMFEQLKLTRDQQKRAPVIVEGAVKMLEGGGGADPPALAA
jgi:hypothetical protein